MLAYPVRCNIEMAATEPMQLHITPPPALILCGNADYVWISFKQQFEMCMKATRANKLEDEQRMALLLTGEGKETLEVYNELHEDGVELWRKRVKLCRNNEFLRITESLEKHVTFESYVIRMRTKNEGETIAELSQN